MANLPLIIRATRSAASATDAMARHSRAIRHADQTMAWNAAMVARGYMSPAAAATDNALCVADKNRATLALARARGRYERANLALARNPID